MRLSRRKFIQSSALGALTATLGSAAERGPDFFPARVERSSDPISYLRREHFEPFLDTAMRVTNENGKVLVVWLRKVGDLTQQINQERGYDGNSYLLSFDVSRKKAITEGTYRFDHENLGRFSLFLAPVGMAGAQYEAVINRIG